jgi:hypothetical protein
VALGTTQSLIGLSTKNTYWGVKPAGELGRQPGHLHAPTVLKFVILYFPEHSRPTQARTGCAFPFIVCIVLRVGRT